MPKLSGPSPATTRENEATSRRVRSNAGLASPRTKQTSCSNIELGVCGLCRVQLAPALCDGPLSRTSINGERSPALTMFIGDVDEQCVPIVLHANSVLRIAFFFKSAHRSTARDTTNE